jgi:hypothetical protein
LTKIDQNIIDPKNEVLGVKISESAAMKHKTNNKRKGCC